jgi:hypothetical protein
MEWVQVGIILIIGGLLSLFIGVRLTEGASVAPILVSGAGNQTCQQLADTYSPGSTWIELKVDPNPVGPGPFNYTDGTLSVVITDASETGFDWTSNIGVDAVFVKSGATGHNLYVYDFFGGSNTESMGDTDLIPPGGNAISHIAFCYDLELQVSKTANPSFDRAWTWTIDKSADQDTLLLADGELFTVNYEVTVSALSADDNHAVAGNITIHNPTATAATVSSVTDVITPGDIAATVTCPSATPFAVAAGATVICTYTASGLVGTETLNTATVTTTSGPEGGSGTAAINWGSATITETDECVDVTDDNLGSPGTLGTVCAGDADKTFNYSLTFGKHADADVMLECGENQHVNIATSVTNDTSTTDTDTWTVNATVACDVGCTLTQGYWKTHSQEGPAPYDDAWLNIGPLQEDTLFFSSGKTYYQILWSAPKKGDAYLILAHQYIAAQLNDLNGVTMSPAVQAAFNSATAYFSGGSATKAQLTSWASILDGFNNGLAGTAHCSE